MTWMRPCGDTEPHEEHVYDHCWVKQSKEPEGWWPPGSYQYMPEFGWQVEYKCRGIEAPPTECWRCGHPPHDPGYCRETWIEPDGWPMDCGCRG